MSAPENPTPDPNPNPSTPPPGHRGPQTVTVRIPVAKPEPTPAKATLPEPGPAAGTALRRAGTVPPPLPEMYKEGAGQAQSTSEPSGGEFGKLQARTPDIKLAASAPPPAPVKTAAMPAPRKTGSVWLVRVGLFAGLGAALALIYWSVFVRFLPMTREHNAKASQMTRAADELEVLRRRFSAEEIEGVRSRYAEAQASLFDLKTETTEWQTQIEEQARSGTLNPNVKFGAPAANTNLNGISAITAEVTLQPDPNVRTTNTPYARLLKFTDGLASSPKRLDLLELSVTGDSNSVSQAQVVVQLLAGEKKL